MRGGKRVGTGPKPKAAVVGMDGRALPPSLPQVEPDRLLLEPPADLEAKAQGVWLDLAGCALHERTLTEETVPGFRQLCQQWVYLRELDVTIQRLGAGTQEAESYFRTYLKLAQRLDGSLARFKLTAFGKPVTPDKPKVAENPWAKVASK